MAHRTTIDVRFNEIDPYGHVNHSVYLTYCEVGRTDALAACGIPIASMAERGIQLVVTSLEARFRAPATAGDTLVVETSIESMRRASGTWAQRILRDDELLLTASVTAGVTDATGKPTRPPDWLFAALEPIRADGS